MEIVTFEEVDPVEVLHITSLSLNYALTPERAEAIRKNDPRRPFPFLGVYAVIDGRVAGQVGVFRMPMTSIEGPEDVGGIWAVCTHPEYQQRGVASALMEEAHERMRTAGLRFSTLGTSRTLVAHRLYHKFGYQDAFIAASALARQETALQKTGLKAERTTTEKFPMIDTFHRRIAKGRTGFARRNNPFIVPMVDTGRLGVDEIWSFTMDGEMLGFAVANLVKNMLVVEDILLDDRVDICAAISALLSNFTSEYVRLNVTHLSYLPRLQEVGYQISRARWGSFMMKSLEGRTDMDEIAELFAIRTDRFLISSLDLT
jgi:GNAT superfamily N-acetyltransferase